MSITRLLGQLIIDHTPVDITLAVAVYACLDIIGTAINPCAFTASGNEG